MKQLLICGLLSASSCLTVSGCSSHDLLSMDSSISMLTPSHSEIFHSQDNGDYKITIYQPVGPVPASGWPILYLLDGDSFFTSAVAEVTKHKQQALVVAIDYEGVSRRELDYLPAPPELVLEILADGRINTPSAYGGADNFWAFIQDELKPELSQRYVLNPTQQAVFGHSLGGLWVLHTLFMQPNSFNHYIASSPSIWFSDRFILQEAQQFVAAYSQAVLISAVDISVSVGAFEQQLTGKEIFPTAHDRQLRAQHLQNRRMVDNVTELASFLVAADIDRFTVTYLCYAEQTHQTVASKVLADRIALWLQSDHNQLP